MTDKQILKEIEVIDPTTPKNVRELTNRFFNEALSMVSSKSRESTGTYYANTLRDIANNPLYGGDTLAILDAFLFAEPEFRYEFNYHRPQNAKVGYFGVLANAKDDIYKAYFEQEKRFTGIKATNLSADAPGVGNTLQNTISQSIARRSDEIGKVTGLVRKITTTGGSYEDITYNKYGMASYTTENVTIPDNVARFIDNPNGIAKKKFTIKPMTMSFRISWFAQEILTPSILNDLLVITEEELSRGSDYQILAGPGSGDNDNGIVNTATSVNTGDLLDNAVRAKRVCQNAHVGNLTYVMSNDAWGEFEKLVKINEPRQNIINLDRKTLYGYPVVEVPSTVLPTVANTTPVIVGNFSDYLLVSNGGLVKKQATASTNFEQVTAFMEKRAGGCRFADSFATFNVTVS